MTNKERIRNLASAMYDAPSSLCCSYCTKEKCTTDRTGVASHKSCLECIEDYFELKVKEKEVINMGRDMKSTCLEQLKCSRHLPDLQYGMYVEAYDYCGFFTETDGNYIYLMNNLNQKVGPFHPTSEITYFDNPMNRTIIYDFKKKQGDKVWHLMDM